MAKKKGPASHTTVYVLGEDEPIHNKGRPTQVPIEFLSDLEGPIVQTTEHRVKVKGTGVMYHRHVSDGYMFVISTLTYRQEGMLR